jgi:hypothetical protein
VNQPIGEKLKQRGLDIEFLAWLEGGGERLPHLNRVRKIKRGGICRRAPSRGLAESAFQRTGSDFPQ